MPAVTVPSKLPLELAGCSANQLALALPKLDWLLLERTSQHRRNTCDTRNPVEQPYHYLPYLSIRLSNWSGPMAFHCNSRSAGDCARRSSQASWRKGHAYQPSAHWHTTWASIEQP